MRLGRPPLEILGIEDPIASRKKVDRLGRKIGGRDTRTDEEWLEGVERDLFRQVVSHDLCSYCGGQFEEIEHIEPQQRWAYFGYYWVSRRISDALSTDLHDSPENIASSCSKCNRQKGSKPLLDFLRWRLLASL